MRGYNGKTTKVNMTDEFSFQFGVEGEFSSELDNAAKVLYEALGEKSGKKEEEQDLLSEITRYFENCILLDDKVVWEHVKSKQKTKDQPQNQEEILDSKLENEEQIAQEQQKSKEEKLIEQ